MCNSDFREEVGNCVRNEMERVFKSYHTPVEEEGNGTPRSLASNVGHSPTSLRSPILSPFALSMPKPQLRRRLSTDNFRPEPPVPRTLPPSHPLFSGASTHVLNSSCNCHSHENDKDTHYLGILPSPDEYDDIVRESTSSTADINSENDDVSVNESSTHDIPTNDVHLSDSVIDIDNLDTQYSNIENNVVQSCGINFDRNGRPILEERSTLSTCRTVLLVFAIVLLVLTVVMLGIIMWKIFTT